MVQVMEYALLGAFVFYLFSTIAFVTAVTGKGSRVGKKAHTRLWGNWGIVLTIIGVALHLVFIVTRVLLGGHFTSNMFEFTAFLCFTIVAVFIVIFFIYRSVTLGAFVMPVAMLMVAYAAVFPKDVEPLIPALQSYWLHVHVTTVAVGEGALAIGFVAGLIYLVRWVGMDRNSKSAVWLEVIMVTILMVAGFVITFFTFSIPDYQATIQHSVEGQPLVQEYDLPPIVGPHNGKVVQMDPFLGMNSPLFEAPSWMKGEEAARKFNSVLWSVLSGLVLYALLRLLLRKRVYELLYPMVKNLDLEKVDEISYRAIAIGFPIFTLGGLIFAMIWAHEAWGRFWGWDPKETWALITWLYYSGYLHFRLSRGWHGLRSSWLAVGGFVVIMINLVAINLVFAGLHSYA